MQILKPAKLFEAVASATTSHVMLMEGFWPGCADLAL